MPCTKPCPSSNPSSPTRSPNGFGAARSCASSLPPMWPWRRPQVGIIPTCGLLHGHIGGKELAHERAAPKPFGDLVGLDGFDDGQGFVQGIRGPPRLLVEQALCRGSEELGHAPRKRQIGGSK